MAKRARVDLTDDPQAATEYRYTPTKLREEVEAALVLRRKHTKLSDELIAQWVGDRYRDSLDAEIRSAENHIHEFLVNTLPVLAWGNPQASWSSSRPVLHRLLVRSIEYGVNFWSKDSQVGKVLQAIATDTIFGFGCGLLTYQPVRGREHDEYAPLLPRYHRISPKRFLCDPQGDMHNARFQGHMNVEDRRAMLDAKTPDGRPKWDREILEAMRPDEQEQDPDMDLQRLRESNVPRVDRDQIAYFEVYVPSEGITYTLAYKANEREAHWLRPPRKCFCPPAPYGPYHLYGIYLVPEQIYPLSPLAVTASLVDEINAHAGQVSSDADESRTVTVINGSNKTLVEAVTRGRHGSVWKVPGFDSSQIAQAELGGPRKEQLDYIEYLRARLDRLSGLTDIRRGNLEKGIKAAQVYEASAADDFRRKWMQTMFFDTVANMLGGAAWYLVNSPNSVFHLPIPKGAFDSGEFEDMAKASHEMEEGTFYGGVEDVEDFDFNNLRLELDTNSLTLTSERALREQMTFSYQQLITWAQAMPNMPWVNWIALIDDYFGRLGVKDARKYIDFAMVAAMTQGLQAQPSPPQQIPGIDGVPTVFEQGAQPGGVPILPAPGGAPPGGPGAAGKAPSGPATPGDQAFASLRSVLAASA